MFHWAEHTDDGSLTLLGVKTETYLIMKKQSGDLFFL